MIPDNITASDILAAIDKIKVSGYDSNRESDIYDVVYEDKPYPQKLVVSYANITANGIALKGFTAQEAKPFLIKRGFPIRVKEAANPEDFFTEEELQFFERYADQPYQDTNPILKNAGSFIRKLYKKNWLWAELVKTYFSFVVTGRAQWNDRGKKGESAQRFRHYTWYKLHDPLNDQSQLYYTVGISGKEKQLIIKIEYQRSGNNALQQEQINFIEEFLKDKNISPRRFSMEEVKQMDWKKLVWASIDFIEKTLVEYRSLVNLISSTNKEMCAKICWNENGWVKPSGGAGKSVTSKSSVKTIQERDHGFGSEEWLFDLDKVIDGYHYVLLQALKSDSHIGKTYNITLFSNNSIEKTWYWIGKIKDIIGISKLESVQVAEAYRSKQWLREQYEQLSDLPDVNVDSYKGITDEHLFNVKFRPEDVTLFERAPFLEGEKIPNKYYNLANKTAEPGFLSLDLTGLLLDPRHGRKSKGKIAKRHTAFDKELDNVHGEIQDQIIVCLQEDHPEMHFYPEGIKRGLLSRIDIVGEKANGSYIFYEIKTYPNVLQSIRVAVGQLLEYAMYPTQHLSSEFYIVTHLEATKTQLNFLRHLSSKIGLQFGYIYFNRRDKNYIVMT